MLPKTFIARMGFRQQLVIAFTLGIVLLALLSSFAIAHLSSQTVRDTLVAQGYRATEALAGQSTLALLYASPENARTAVEGVLAFPDVQGVAIFDHEHKLLLEKGKLARPQETVEDLWPDELRLVSETSKAWYFVCPVYIGSRDADEESPFDLNPRPPELIGFVRLVVGKETLDAMAFDILRGNLLVSCSFAAVLLLVLYSMTTRLTRPLKHLAEIMRRAELGEQQMRAALDGPKEIVRMESAFNTMMEVLERREEELKRARDAALDMARMKGEFAANVSHELRTPLNGVLGMLELLATMGLTSKQGEYVEVAHQSAEYLLKLIENVLDFSKLSAGKMALEEIDFRLRELLDDLVQLFAAQVQPKGLDIGYRLAPEVPPLLCGEPSRLRQVLINLIGNAVKFTDAGEIGIAVQVIGEEDHWVRLRFEVSDTGIGIPEGVRGQIFEAFSQADGSTTRKYGGTGLGLAISRQLVELMEGEIGVESEPGQGSTFWFTVRLRWVTRASSPVKTDRAAGTGLRVLIVEDSRVSRIYLEQMLNTWGASWESAARYEEAFARLQAAAAEGNPYTVALVDEKMPEGQAAAFIEQIHQDPALAATRIILMTNGKPLDQRRARQQGIIGAIPKPVRESFLYDCIASAKGEKAKTVPDAGRATDAAPLRFRGRVLVVEDNRTSQQVAEGMLERSGCTVKIAADGREALEDIVRNPFDLVLMDCHMPHLDGYETTARIRTLEANRSRIPIVAMTASVHEGDIERCLAAGMDDYLSKPLKLDRLQDKLAQWLPSQEEGELPQVVAATMTGEEQTPLDRAVLEELQSAVGDGFQQLIGFFVEDTSQYVASMREAIAGQDPHLLAELAHSLTGSAGNLGAHALAGLCKQLEMAGRGGALERAEEIFPAVVLAFDLVEAALLEEIHGEESLPLVHEQVQVLIVDDDRGLRFAVRSVLEKDGYDVEEVGDGAHALAVCERKMPDLVLLDALMPVMDGFTVCSHLRELPGGSQIPILIITAFDDEFAVERAFAVGATDYIPKPLHLAVLRQRIAHLLRAKQAEKHVRSLAYRDALTGLPNRAGFREHLATLLERANREGYMVALLFLDLDRFKLVNDTLGHDIGDLLLKTVAERLTHCVRKGDMVARFGGDEFMIVLNRLPEPQVAARVADKVGKALAEPFAFVGREMYVGTSIGISVYPGDGKDIATLVRHADMAMYGAKEQGGKYQFYEVGMDAVVSARLDLESALRRALEKQEFVLFYQPQTDLRTGRIVGMEALIRWQHPERGLVSPVEFIPVAEETDALINAIGEWVLRTACQQLRSWLQAGIEVVPVSVNLSGRQLESGALVPVVAALLEKCPLPPGLLGMEITESVIMKHADEVISTLRQLRGMGITLAIDDFGTGYSSLSYLKRFPIDTLKIDRSFVRDICTDKDDAAIVSGIVAMAKRLDLQVIAEGVETEAQASLLRKQGCDMGQGYLFSRPVPPIEIPKHLMKRPALVLLPESGIPVTT